MRETAELDEQHVAFDSLVLLQAKVRVPPLRPALVERRQLLADLASARETAVVVVTAPPGYGKTTLLAQWAEADDRPFAYLHLDDADNDPVVLLAYITAALERFGEVDSRVTDELREPAPALGRAVLPGLANEIADRNPFVLAFDDVHVLRDEMCLRTIAYLAENVPAGSQLALAGRADPGISLASLRVERNLLEIRADRLVFDADEAGRLFAALGVDLEEGDVRRLVEQTEGWPAGLYLAALYLRGCDEPAKYVHRFRGDHRNVADYFIAEVLARQPDEALEFLRRTAILDRLSGPLCDAVLAAPTAPRPPWPRWRTRSCSSSHSTNGATGIATTTSSPNSCSPSCSRTSRRSSRTCTGARRPGTRRRGSSTSEATTSFPRTPPSRGSRPSTSSPRCVTRSRPVTRSMPATCSPGTGGPSPPPAASRRCDG